MVHNISVFTNLSHKIVLKMEKLRKPYNGSIYVWRVIVNDEDVFGPFFDFEQATEFYVNEVKEQLDNNMAY